jgi:hypothetical protein
MENEQKTTEETAQESLNILRLDINTKGDLLIQCNPVHGLTPIAIGTFLAYSLVNMHDMFINRYEMSEEVKKTVMSDIITSFTNELEKNLKQTINE